MGFFDFLKGKTETKKINPEKVLKVIEWAKKNNISEKKIPRNVNLLIELKELNLSFSLPDWIRLPDEICFLTNLEVIKLSHNSYSTLPENIGNLSNLIELNLGVTNISSFPSSIVNLKKLKKLNLYGLHELELTEPQWEWITELNKKGCFINE